MARPQGDPFGITAGRAILGGPNHRLTDRPTAVALHRHLRASTGTPPPTNERRFKMCGTGSTPSRPDILCSVAASVRTRYAKCGDGDIAYQVLSDGPIDLLLCSGVVIPIDCMDEEPSMARFQRRLASFARLLRFDIRGVGLSDRGSPSAPPTHVQGMSDALAVLDAVGSERAAVIAPGFGSAVGLTLAATHPERVTHLVLVNGAARDMGTRLSRGPTSEPG